MRSIVKIGWISGLVGLGVLLVLVAAAGGCAARPVAPAAQVGSAVITGTVVWKGSGEPVAGARVVLRTPDGATVMGESPTDVQGVYVLTAAVGDWLVEVTSTEGYFGYGQKMTAFPHSTYQLNFGVTPAPAPPPTALRGGPGTSLPSEKLPAAGQPAAPGAWFWLLLGAGLLIGGVGLGRRRPHKERG